MMIVKDEAPVIARCLESVRSLIDWWVIADTGSTDGTRELVREALAGLPGELVDRPWVDFGHNRQDVLELARAAHPDDYALWIDADEELDDTAAGICLDAEADGYMLTTVYGWTEYARLAVVRLDRPWAWRGPVHEYLNLPDARLCSLVRPTVRVHHDGARAHDPSTYLRDVGLIRAALDDTPKDPRMEFYLAQSLRDAGQLDAALAAYLVRAANPAGWAQERWYALFQAATLREQLGHDLDAVIGAHMDAWQACQWRAEPLVAAARIERVRGRFAVAFLYAHTAAEVPLPGHEGLFVDVEAYNVRRWDEIAVNGYWSGHHAEAADAARRAVAGSDDPRLVTNLEWCEAAACRA